ncbi:MAG: transporter [Gammaproteobacteria bacterium]|nr:transporter [Gammaproteobacteria bacterium]
MSYRKLLSRTVLICSLGITTSVSADSLQGVIAGNLNPIKADSHAPIGVMGDHMHSKGEWMISYRYMQMRMEDNRDGTHDLSPAEIATGVTNPFFGQPMQPPTLRVVPTKMRMEMHMLGGMYAPSDNLTLMAMLPYTKNEMDHLTFSGGMGTTLLGGFTTQSSGIGDLKLSGLYRLFDDATHHLHLNVGISLPTGATDEEDQVLTPMGATPTLRLPYPMQLGSGTYDLLPGLTYSGEHGQLGWGSQYSAVVRLGKNDDHYALGDQHRLSAWGSYRWRDGVSSSLRLAAQTIDDIDGIDPLIVAPVQTADPANQGGERVDLFVGLNLVGQRAALRGHRLALEIGTPIYEDLNGPQLKTDWIATVGYQYAF